MYFKDFHELRVAKQFLTKLYSIDTPKLIITILIETINV